MFSSLIESGSHRTDLRRRGAFLLGTFAFYAVLLAAAGVGSIYAYNVSLDDGAELEVLAIMRFSPKDARPEPERRDEPRPAASSSRAPRVATRPEISINTPYHADRIARATTKEINPRAAVVIDGTTSDPADAGGAVGPNIPGARYTGSGAADHGPKVADVGDAPPPAPTPRPAPTPERVEKKKTTTVSLGVINGKAVSKPPPVYTAIAKAARASGVVSVQIAVDEQGRVVSAQATSGHPLLRQPAVEAAYRARFTPTYLSNQPVKVTGFITYNFILQ